MLAHVFWLTELAVLAFEGCPTELDITHWWNDRVLAARKRKGQLSLATIPDGLLVVRNRTSGKRYPCLIELDLGTETVTSAGRARPDFARKIEGYLDYHETTFRAEFDVDAAPVVLIVTDSPRRMDSLRATTARLGGRGRFWFAPLPHLRDFALSNPRVQDGFAARQGAFWTAQWRTPHEDGLRSLATRCGVPCTARD